MITITLENPSHLTKANVRVNPTGETEISKCTVYSLKRKLCTGDKNCHCPRNALGAYTDPSAYPKVIVRGEAVFIDMGSGIASTKAPAEVSKKVIKSSDEVNNINFTELESIIMVGGALYLKEMLTDVEQQKLFTIIRGIRDERRKGVTIED
jgi:hypothetical protein